MFHCGAWTALPDPPCGQLVGCAAVVHDGYAIILGGNNSNEFLNCMYKLVHGTWIAMPSMQRARCHFAAGVLGNFLVVAGGCVEHGGDAAKGFAVTPMAEVFNFKTNTWAELPQMPIASCAAGSAVTDDGLMVIGGRTATKSQEATSQVHLYDLKQSCWSRLPDLPQCFTFQQHAVVVRGTVYAIGHEEAHEFNKERTYWKSIPHPSDKDLFEVGLRAVVLNEEVHLLGTTVECPYGWKLAVREPVMTWRRGHIKMPKQPLTRSAFAAVCAESAVGSDSCVTPDQL